jgi:hypothetical protein
MKREEAKHLLHICRPGNDEDRKDPLVAEALAALEHDSELRAWFDEQQALDTQISDLLDRIEPPADLKTSILAGMRAHQAQAQAEAATSSLFSQSEDRPKPHWRSPWMGIAALFAVLFVIAVVQRPSQTRLASSDTRHAVTAGAPDFINFLANEIGDLNGWQFDQKNEQAEQLQNYLASTGMPNPAHIPGKLNALPTIGCVTFDYNGTKLSMICFRGDNVYHLITAEKSALQEVISEQPKIYECSGQAFKVWAQGEQILILSVEGTEQDIPEFI